MTKVQVRVFNLFDLFSKAGGLIPALLLFGLVILNLLNGDPKIRLDNKMVRCSFVIQDEDDEKPFSRKKLTHQRQDDYQDLLKKGRQVLYSKSNLHYMINRIDKLECLLSTLVHRCMDKSPNDFQDLLTEYAKLFLHQNTIYGDDVQLKTKEDKEKKEIEGAKSVHERAFGDDFCSQQETSATLIGKMSIQKPDLASKVKSIGPE